MLDATGSAVTLHSDGSVTIEAKSGVTVDAGTSSLELKGGDISITAPPTGRRARDDGGRRSVKVDTAERPGCDRGQRWRDPSAELVKIN